MLVTTDPDRARWAGRLRIGVLTLVALLSAHTAIYVAQYGLGNRFAAAMANSGHDGWWVPASVIALGGGVVALLSILGTMTRLETIARSTSRMRARRRETHGPPFWREVVTIWRRLRPAVTVAFAVQENLEHLAAHGHLLGLEALGGHEYPLALPVLALVTLALSWLGALVRWRIATLRACVGTASQLRRRRLAAETAAGRWQIVGDLAPRDWMSARLDAGRAPPRPLRS